MPTADNHHPFIVQPPDWPSTIRLFQAPQLTDEQREQIRQAVANFSAGLRQIREAFGPAALAAARQLEELGEKARANAHTGLPAWASPYGPAPRRR